MSVTFVADVHVDNFARWGGPMRGGLNTRALAVLAALEEAVEISLQDDEGELVVLGDLFNRSQPEPPLVYGVQQVLDQHPNPYVLIGNHDAESTDFAHNACAPLYHCANVVEEPTAQSATPYVLWLVPFRPGPILTWLPDVLADLEEYPQPVGARRVLCMHAGISDKGTPYYLDETAGSINITDLRDLMEEYDVAYTFAGDWHRHQRWDLPGGRVAMQVGALAPNRFPPNYEHGDRGPCVTLEDDGTIIVHDVPGPRFHKKRWSGLDQTWRPTGAPAFVKLTCRSDQADDAREWLKALQVNEALAHGTKLGGVELEIDRGIERAKARTASFEARQANSLDEALARYVKAMPLDKGVDRDAVLAHVRRLIG